MRRAAAGRSACLTVGRECPNLTSICQQFSKTIRCPRPSASTRSSSRAVSTPAAIARVLRESIVDGAAGRGHAARRDAARRRALGQPRARAQRAPGAPGRGPRRDAGERAHGHRALRPRGPRRPARRAARARVVGGTPRHGDPRRRRAGCAPPRGVPAGGRVDRAARRARHRVPPRPRRVRRQPLPAQRLARARAGAPGRDHDRQPPARDARNRPRTTGGSSPRTSRCSSRSRASTPSRSCAMLAEQFELTRVAVLPDARAPCLTASLAGHDRDPDRCSRGDRPPRRAGARAARARSVGLTDLAARRRSTPSRASSPDGHARRRGGVRRRRRGAVLGLPRPGTRRARRGRRPRHLRRTLGAEAVRRDLGVADLAEMFTANVTTAFVACRAVLPAMIARAERLGRELRLDGRRVREHQPRLRTTRRRRAP